jgi:hypothetical protein
LEGSKESPFAFEKLVSKSSTGACLTRQAFEEARRALERISRQWDQALARLNLFVEE